MIPPGATIGILGGGQLGRMLALAGRAMGYRFHVYEPKGPSAAGMAADRETNAGYTDADALRRFAREVDLITLEFENVPLETLEILESVQPVFPGREALGVCQNRRREKDFLKDNGLPHTPFLHTDSPAGLVDAVGRLGAPCVAKTAVFGYDGKGQVRMETAPVPEEAEKIWEQLGGPDHIVVEQWLRHQGEYSVVCARRKDGAATTFPMTENRHHNHILHTSIAPSGMDAAILEEGESLARRIAEKLGVVGLIAVEFFLDRHNRLIVNEMAPRPHNSGHYSIEGCGTSQFEQHIRAITGLPLGSTELLRPTVMVNLLGDLWDPATPDWSALLQDPRLHLHLYDKGEPRPGRKMGHFTVLDPDVANARAAALEAEARISGNGPGRNPAPAPG